MLQQQEIIDLHKSSKSLSKHWKLQANTQAPRFDIHTHAIPRSARCASSLRSHSFTAWSEWVKAASSTFLCLCTCSSKPSVGECIQLHAAAHLKCQQSSSSPFGLLRFYSDFLFTSFTVPSMRFIRFFIHSNSHTPKEYYE